jgi:hypothetical protein
VRGVVSDGHPYRDPEIRQAMAMEKPELVYWSVLENGRLALLNFQDQEAVVRQEGGRTLRLKPYTVMLL